MSNQLLLTNLALIAVAMGLLWIISVTRHDVSIVDIFWGCGFAIVAWVSIGLSEEAVPRAYLLAVLVTLWGLRLAMYLAWRNWGKPEDRRYAEMREKHGQVFPLVSLVTVFGLQGLLMWIISWPVQVGVVAAEGWNLLVAIGAALWLLGMFFESVGDYQLARFKSKPQNEGQVMDHGLWRYTRHPNYFGDFLVWWGFYLIGAEPESWWWTIVGPIVMSVLLMRVSGVTLLEKSLQHRVSGYDEYKRTTSAFFPMPPKSRESVRQTLASEPRESH